MSLIERLGGYEAAKAEGEKWGFDDFLNNQLLEYRRQHNIFEVGDKVVLAQSYPLDTVHEIKRIEKIVITRGITTSNHTIL